MRLVSVAVLAVAAAVVSVSPSAAVDQTPCAGDELAGAWLLLYQFRDAEHCRITVDADGLITESACTAQNKRTLRETIKGTLELDAACNVTGDLEFSRASRRKGAAPAAAKGKYGAFSVDAHLSEDRSTIVGLFGFRRAYANVVGARIGVAAP